MQKYVTPAIVALGLSLTLPACDAPEDLDDLDTIDYRMLPPQDGDIAIHLGPSADTGNDDCLAWDIVGSCFALGPAAGPGLAGTDLWNVTGLGEEIFDHNGNLLCTMHAVGPDYVELREGTSGPVVASQWHNHAFFGDVSNIPESIRWDFADYTFNGPHLAEGPAYGEKVVTATEFVEYAQTKRKMAIAALVMGVCGSNGLPTGP